MTVSKHRRCAIYTRKSSDEGLDQSFNSLDAQRDACEAYVKSQAHEGWHLISKHYDDGGYSGGSMERPGLKALMVDRHLIVNEAESNTVRTIFTRFIKLGSVPVLLLHLHATGITSKRWTSRAGKPHGGVPFGRGALYYLLRNRLYLGETRHRKTYYSGQHTAIVPKPHWDKANAILDGHCAPRSKAKRTSPAHLLTGLLYDDRGNRMSPSHARKKDGRRY